jgi:methylmalonyl-CoA mutase cobalamin-binding subunit
MTVQQMLIPDDLPHGSDIVERGRRIGNETTVGVSLLCQAHGVRSEVEYKKKMTAEGRLMSSLIVGMQTWAKTRDALKRIWEETDRRGFRVDRYLLALDRRMGVPAEDRPRAAKETGPMLETEQQWRELALTVPIQPHLGDMMIGSPMSVDNARRALSAGVNYIGNIGQFSWKYPSWRGTDVDQVVETVTAVGLMASKNADGAVIHEYLDDGFGALFADFSSYIGWSLFDRYVVQDLCGAQLGVSYGGLTSNPVMKAAMILALEEIKQPTDAPTPFYYTTTTAYSDEIDSNLGALALDALFTMLAVHRVGGGAATNAVPVTETLRIPSWLEIVQAQSVLRRVAEEVHRIADVVDWDPLLTIRDQLIQDGRRFFDNLMNGFESLGVPTGDPLHLLVASRRLGAAEIERRWGAGEVTDDPYYNGYRPLLPTDTLSDLLGKRRSIRDRLAAKDAAVRMQNERVVVVSTDVHEFGMHLVADAVISLGGDPVVAGTGVDPDELADLAWEVNASVVLVSTHNGMALAYTQQLLDELRVRRMRLKVVIGGVLNQDFPGEATPRDVTAEIVALGIGVCKDPAQLPAVLAEIAPLPAL